MKHSRFFKCFSWLLIFCLYFSLFMATPVKAQSLKASPGSIYFGPNQKITVSFSGAPGKGNDWIGIFKAGTEPRSYISYQYLKGKKSGILTFNAPEEVGKYEFRMFDTEALDSPLAVSNQVSITYPPAKLKLGIQKMYIGPNKKISVSYEHAPGYDNDWIGLFNIGAEPTSYITYQYLKGKTSGTLEFAAPEKPGSYEFRMWGREYTKHLTTSTPLVIEWGPVSINVKVSNPDTNGKRKITVQYSGAPGYDNDWIGLFYSGAAITSYITYQYLKGKTSGTLEFACPDDAKTYEIRMWAAEYTHLLAKTQAFIPKNGPPPPVDQDPATPKPPTPEPPNPSPAPDKPFTLRAYPGHGKVLLEWTPPKDTSNVIGYNLYRNTSRIPYGSPITDFPITGLKHLDKNVDNGMKACYYMKAVYKDKSESSSSNEVCVTPATPNVVVNIPSNATTNQPNFTFTGTVPVGSTLTVNGTTVTVGANGSFTATVKLNPGKNTIKIIVNTKTGAIIVKTHFVTLITGADGKITILLTIGSKNAYVNKQLVVLDVPPFIDSGRTFVPFRFIGESLGAVVGFSKDTSGRVDTVTYSLDKTNIILYIGKREATVNGKTVYLDVAPQILQGRTVIPLRFVTEALGCKVDWDGQKMQVIIVYPA